MTPSHPDPARAEDLGQRIHVIGNSCAGKSTLAAELAERLELPVVELDALNWLPDWHGLNAHDPDRFRARIRAATSGERWVVAGSYLQFSQACFWDRLETLIWLDLPRWKLVLRVLRRSWRRWRSRELLWGGNVESFWQQLRIWEGEDSLLWWIWTQYARKRAQMLAIQAEPRWQHIHVIQLRSQTEVEAFLRGLP